MKETELKRQQRTGISQCYGSGWIRAFSPIRFRTLNQHFCPIRTQEKKFDPNPGKNPDQNTSLHTRVVDLNTLNLDPDPGFWPNLDPDPG